MYIYIDFELQEKRQMEKELAAFQASLDAEMKAEEERYQRNISTLSKRKEEMVKSKKEKLKVSGACWDINEVCWDINVT